MRQLAARSGRTVCVNLNQTDKAPDLWRDVLAKLDEDRADGLPIFAQVHGRTVGLLMCLEGSYHPLMFHPAYQRSPICRWRERCRALRSGPIRDRIINELPDDGGIFENVVLSSLAKTWAVGRRRHRLRTRTVATRSGACREHAAGSPGDRDRRSTNCSPPTATACCRRRSSTTATAT